MDLTEDDFILSKCEKKKGLYGVIVIQFFSLETAPDDDLQPPMVKSLNPQL